MSEPLAFSRSSGLLSSLRNENQAIDMVLLVVIGCCLAMGLVMVGSASGTVAEARYGSPFFFLNKQLVFMLGGLIVMAALMCLPMSLWEKTSMLLLFCAIVMLSVVLFVGKEVNGSTRWIHLGLFNLQPSEVAKLFVIIYIASFLSRKQDEVRGPGWGGFVKPLVVLGGIVLLLLLQPDYGSSVVLIGAVMGMILLAGARALKFIVVLSGVTGALAILAVAEPYRIRRLITYTDPWANQFGDGYQLTQSLIGFGRGGWLGEGLGDGIQKLFFLPEAHTDFIFSVIAEELGLVGALIVIGALFFIAWRGLQIGYRAEQAGQLFSGYLAYGVSLLLSSQVFINVGVSSGLLPTKGLALPLFSYGGSSLIMSCFAVGLLMRVDYECRTAGAVTAKIKARSETSKQEAYNV